MEHINHNLTHVSGVYNLDVTLIKSQVSALRWKEHLQMPR